MTKWTNNDGEIFEDEDAARDYCYDSETKDDIIEVIKDNIEDYYNLILDVLWAHDVCDYQKLQDEILDRIWEKQGFREIEVKDKNGE